VVTGGCGIQGVRVTRGLAAYGAAVAVVDLDEGAAKKLAGEIADEYGVKTLGIACDVSREAEVGATVARVTRELGRIDVLHNNAAWKGDDLEAFYAPAEAFAFATWREVMSVNLDGAFLVAQAAGRQMLKQGGGGSIVNVASIYGLVGPDFGIYEGSEYNGHRINTPPAYAASKAGLIGLTKYLATCWAEKGIRVNALVPGGIESGQNDVFRRAYAARTPMGRMAEADEMVGAVVYLASNASSYVTGQTLAVDGGWTAW
jgi:NAD(P)-dependent dehydrogenase (short-subunit alcohol dehydrogenase family)